MAASLAAPAMRVSRRMANEIGISAEVLRQFMTYSPSPKKNTVSSSLIAAPEMQTKVSSPISEKENISGVDRFPEDTFILPNQQEKSSQSTEPILSMKNGGSVSVTRLQLKKLDQNATAKESQESNQSFKCSVRSQKSNSSTSSETPNSVDRSTHNNKRRLKVCRLPISMSVHNGLV